MKIFAASDIREIDAATIRFEPVTSAGLMERAASALYKRLRDYVPAGRKVIVFAGPGNNGGDGLVIARLFHDEQYPVRVYVIETGSRPTADFILNDERLRRAGVTPVSVSETEQFPVIGPDDIIIDSIFGTGLTRKPAGLAAEVIRKINATQAYVVSVDIPSGLFCEDNSGSDPTLVVRADVTLTFQFPKLSFMLPGSGDFAGKWEVVDIGLHQQTINSIPTNYFFTLRDDIRPLLRRRKKFDHKGMFGHALIIAGSLGKTGAATLAAGAALRTGAGLVTVHAPVASVVPLQSSLPEAMVSPDQGTDHLTGLPELERFDAIAVGPGLGTDPDTAEALRSLLTSARCPLVIDADALNLIAADSELLPLIPQGSVLTPHPGEFRRLTGCDCSDFARLEKQASLARELNCVVVLKGAYTSVALPDGSIHFNSSGNPGMATGGSGDVLTGMITALLSQGLTPPEAALAGVYLHGVAGDVALRIHSEESVIAGDILTNIGRAFRETQFNNFSLYL